MEAPVLDRPDASPEFRRRPRVGPKPNLSRVIMRWLLIGTALYLGILIVLFALQANLIFPGSETQGKESAIVHPTPGTELVTLTTENQDRVVALFGPALLPDGNAHPDASQRPTLIYFYGNAMCLNDTMFEFDHFRRLGLNVLIPEFVGYGMSTGKPSEAGCRETADAAFAHLQERKDINPKRIIAGGWSLGGAVAVDLASRKPLAGLIAFSTFTSMGDMSRRSFPFVPVSLILRHRFESETKMRKINCPILLGHGRRDEIVPVDMQDRLAAAASRAPVMKFVVDEAGHNDFYSVGKEQVFQAVSRFLEQVTDPH
jgi:fermentation-respiration switch protein FrsA (DUF1100 family)